ncbi:MAG TPA: hypothetical protein VHU85_15530 [Acidimicrobiales bacterium]|jgi:hypothetical protein|nr:hypothetical protein [Acidimicrobiales bacterium]
MASLQADLGRLLTDSYLRGIESKSLDDIRSMRAECQSAEVALSYLRRLAQGRLDIVQAYLVRPVADGDPAATEPPDLAALVEGLPAILSSGPGRPPGPGHMVTVLAPDTEDSDLTAELDSVVSSDEIGHLGELSQERLSVMADGLEEIERRVSADRRALHQRIDTLQAELVSRYKTGRASVDGLLS